MVATTELTRINDDLFGDRITGGFSHYEEIADGITGDPILIPPTGRGNTSGSVQLICGDNTGNIDYTIDTFDVISEGNATWLPWSKGEVTGTVLDIFIGPISAVRGVSVDGSIILKILI